MTKNKPPSSSSTPYSPDSRTNPPPSSSTSTALPIRIHTHNIRYATAHPFPGECPWPIRAPLLLAELAFSTRHIPPAFICLQEVLHHQLTHILARLNHHHPPAAADEEWSALGIGRDNGLTAGEYAPILFRPRVWRLRAHRTLWLSETPDRPSTGWDAASRRIVTMGLFEHVATGRRVVGANTHLDDQGAVARREGARLIVRAMGEFVALADADADGAGEGRARGRTHVFLAGDMNSETTGAAYKILNGDESLVRDVREYVGEKERYGDVDTFTGFGSDGEQPTRIDFVFVGKEDVEGVDGYAVLENRFEDGVYCSDHRAVVGDVVLAS